MKRSDTRTREGLEFLWKGKETRGQGDDTHPGRKGGGFLFVRSLFFFSIVSGRAGVRQSWDRVLSGPSTPAGLSTCFANSTGQGAGGDGGDGGGRGDGGGGRGRRGGGEAAKDRVGTRRLYWAIANGVGPGQSRTGSPWSPRRKDPRRSLGPLSPSPVAGQGGLWLLNGGTTFRRLPVSKRTIHRPPPLFAPLVSIPIFFFSSPSLSVFVGEDRE